MRSVLSLAACAVFMAGVSSAQTAKEKSLGSTSVLFHRACAVCHGLNGNGGRGPDLVSGRWNHGSTDADLERVIASGVPGTDMPAFGERFNQEEIGKLVAFVRSLSSGGGSLKITGNVERGQQIYWGKGACASCHMVNGQGGTLGPELSRIGAQRSPASLKESIVSPSANIVTGYQTAKVTMSGRTITGIRKNEDDYSIQVYDGDSYHSFDKTKVDRLDEPSDSLMPPSALSAAEIDDLIAYLDTLRAPQLPASGMGRGRRR